MTRAISSWRLSNIQKCNLHSWSFVNCRYISMLTNIVLQTLTSITDWVPTCSGLCSSTSSSLATGALLWIWRCRRVSRWSTLLRDSLPVTGFSPCSILFSSLRSSLQKRNLVVIKDEHVNRQAAQRSVVSPLTVPTDLICYKCISLHQWNDCIYEQKICS